jgi:asparagine synthase (glutamine-hydrolysing)
VHSLNSVVLFQLMKLARSQGVKVVLSGQGADEVLAGYSSYFMDYWVELLRAGRPEAAWREVESLSRQLAESPLAHYSATLRVYLKQMLHLLPGYTLLADQRRRREVAKSAWLSAEVRRHWRPAERIRARTLNEALRWSLEHANLPLYLRVEDRNSMAHGVEARMPFLDHRLVSLAFRLGPEWKLRGGCTKVLLRESMRDRVPEIVRTRPGKFGFPVAVDSWFRGDLYEPMKDMLASRTVRESGLWNVPAIDRDLDRHRRGDDNIGVPLFDVIQSCLWMQGFGGRSTAHTAATAHAAETAHAAAPVRSV